MRNILVTGSAGFVGSHLCNKLDSLGYGVIPMDIKSIGDVRSVRQCSDFTRGVDIIIHLAALVDVQESIRIPKVYHKTNVIGTLNLLKVSQSAERFIYISSAAAKNPTSPYGIQKFTSEMYCDFYNKLHSLSTISLRPFNIYGPGNGKGVIDKWIDTIRSNSHPVIYGGYQCRDFIYIDDVIDSICEQIGSKEIGVKDVSTGLGTNMLDLCDLLLRVMDRTDLQPVIKPQQKGEIQRSIGLPYLHKYSLENGLRKMI